MMDDVYKTVEGIAEGSYKEKGSKFISFIYPVKNENQIKELMTGIKEKYYDARHHCYAYMLGGEKKNFRANDDGEPFSTAGKPILGQICANDLTDVLLVVVRYFGGTKLGVSGLITAYRSAAADAIAHAYIVEKTINTLFHIRFTYAVMNDVMRIVKEEAPEVLLRDFGTECNMLFSIRNKSAGQLRERLLKVESMVVEEGEG